MSSCAFLSPIPTVTSSSRRLSFISPIKISRPLIPSVPYLHHSFIRLPSTCSHTSNTSHTSTIDKNKNIHSSLHPLKSIITAIAVTILPHFITTSSLNQFQFQSSSITSTIQQQSSYSYSFSSTTIKYPLTFINSATLPQTLPTWIKLFIPLSCDSLHYQLLKSLLLLGIVVAVIFGLIVCCMVVIQDSLVYKPTKIWRGNPALSGMPYYDDVDFKTKDGKHLKGWFIKQNNHDYSNARTLIYFHGTDKNASFRLGKIIGLYEHCKCNILLISYRGYGLSTGKPNERGIHIDAQATYNYLLNRKDLNIHQNLWVYGESLGGAVAIYFSKVYQHVINALILENTFTSLLDMIKLEIPFLGIFRYLSWNRWQSKKRIGHLSIPLLFLSGLKDAYIPPIMMKQMYQLATSSKLKEFVEFENGTHNRTWTSQGFYESIAKFMDRVDNEKQNLSNNNNNEHSSISQQQQQQQQQQQFGIDDNGRVATA